MDATLVAIDVQELSVPSTETVETPPAPVQPPNPRVETTPSEPGRGESPIEETAATDETSPASAAPARPKLSELLKDPEIAREHEGITGERIRRERQQAIEDFRRMQEQETAQSRLVEQQKAEKAEADYRAWEDQYEMWLIDQGDPNYELEGFVKTKIARRNEADASRKEQSAQRELDIRMAESEIRGQRQALSRWDDDLKAEFYALPKAVQEKLSQKPYYGDPKDPDAPFKARAQFRAEMRTEREAHWKEQEGDRTRAQIKRELAKYQIEQPELDAGGGNPVAGGYTYMEDVEKAYKAGTMTTDDYLGYRQRNTPYRRGR